MTHVGWLVGGVPLAAAGAVGAMTQVGWLVGGALFAAAGVPAGAGARRLLGRLRRGARVRPPGCELAVAAGWGGAGGAWAAGALPGAWLPVLLALAWFAVAAAAVDLTHLRLPDSLTLPALPAALLLVVPLGVGAVLRGAAGAVVAAAAHAAVHLAARRAMGAGDVKLAAPLGAVLAAASWSALALAALLAALFTGLVAVAGVCSRRLARGAAVPHGPSMAVAAWLVAVGSAVGSAAAGVG
jgi:leader peptidase (prepilin peptidase) / N-methyltransferase